jgi:pantoate--beta-alanine ligase
MTPLVLRTVSDFREACDRARAAGKRVGLVPTMGALHAGHLALATEARRHAETVAVTIFVNPTQFGPQEDFGKYPRDLSGDLEKCGSVGVDLVFAPDAASMYPAGERTRVRVEGLTRALCGASRPGHFEGVTTIVCKLFAVTGACTAVFGRKDYQQLKVIERMTRDLLLPVSIVGHPIVREADGLALSSRNAYLSSAERQRGLAISRALTTAVRSFGAGERSAGVLRANVRAELEAAELRVDYVELAEADTVEPYADPAVLPPRALLAVAAFAGNTRLIDNVVLGEDPAPVEGSP